MHRVLDTHDSVAEWESDIISGFMISKTLLINNHLTRFLLYRPEANIDESV